ncbi:hypothetical protein ACFWSP_35430 [Streptomyces sp. NPDC058618]|uniref:hypothetical protein n=1 Tax=Streptomyces sp. NPDC058618 TaxID=3346558 RepID=UPI00365475E2
MPEDDVKAALTAKRIAELETELHRFSGMLANLQEAPGTRGHLYVSERIEEIVAEIEALKAPAEEPKPAKDGPPLHTVLVVIGLIVGSYGLVQRAWAQLVLGVVLLAVSQLVKPKDTDTDSIKNSG